MTQVRVWFSVLTVGLLSSAGLTEAAHQQAQPASTSPAHAASQPDTASPQPRFRVGIDAVRLDAVVTDRDGRPVTDLTAADFDLHQDGRPQKITLARWVPLAAPRAHAAVAPAAPSAS